MFFHQFLGKYSYSGNLVYCNVGKTMNEIEKNHLIKIISRLSQEHRDLKMTIKSMLQTDQHQDVQIQKLINRRDQIKQVILTLNDKLIPDIIA